MIAPALTQRVARVEAREQRAILDSRGSLARFLSHAAIDARPQPLPWGRLREPWQAEGLRPVIPAIEAACGLRPPLPEGSPRRFWRTRPKGHFKTGEIALLVGWALAFSPRPIHAIAAASARDQARFVRDALDRIKELNPWFGGRIKVNQYDAYGPGGSLEILSSEVGSSSGQLPDITICDELTWWANRQLWDVLLAGMIKRPQSVLLVITNAGIVGTWQHEILVKAKASPLWNVRETPVGVRLASWQSEEEVAADRAMMTIGTAARSYDNRWTDGADAPLFPADLVEACSRPRSQLLWGDPLRPPTGPKNLLLGYDVGKVDRAALWIVERTAPRTYVARWMERSQGKALKDQEERLRQIIRATRNRLVRGNIDLGSIGYQLAETLSTEFRGLIEGVACGETWQGRAALAVQLAGRERRLELPGLETGTADPELIADFGQVEQVGDRRDGTPIVDTLKTDLGHADRFWGLALAIDAGSAPVRPPFMGAS